MFSVQYTMALLELQGYFLHCNVHHIYHISRRCWSSTLSRTPSRGSRRNFKRAAAPILLLELMISILTGWYTSLCVSASHHVSSVFLWIQPFSTRTPLNAWLLPLFWFFVQNSLSLFPSVVPARANACKRFPFAKDSEQHEKPSICKLQRSALTYSINSFNYSTMTVNFAWFLTTKPYHMHAVK